MCENPAYREEGRKPAHDTESGTRNRVTTLVGNERCHQKPLLQRTEVSRPGMHELRMYYHTNICKKSWKVRGQLHDISALLVGLRFQLGFWNKSS